jgi:hypothetical protein
MAIGVVCPHRSSLLPIPIPFPFNFQLSVEDPHHVGTFDLC